jgi:DNA invertase Pin-like site-specific DNA recombinase
MASKFSTGRSSLSKSVHGRLTLNVLLSFAQFEREVTGERIRDKIGASKRRGLWVGGMVPGTRSSSCRVATGIDENSSRVERPNPLSWSPRMP